MNVVRKSLVLVVASLAAAIKSVCAMREVVAARRYSLANRTSFSVVKRS